MTGEFYKISVHLIGVKKRCRKSERHVLSLGYIPYNNGEFNQSEIENKVRSAIAENMKTVNSAVSVALNFVEWKNDQYGTIQTWQMFGSKNVSFKLQTSLEKELA